MNELEKRNSGKVARSDIQDAEFVEIDERGHPTQMVTPAPPPPRRYGCLKIAAICAAVIAALVAALIILLATVGPPPSAPAMLNNNADEVEDAAANSLDRAADTVAEGPSLTALLANNDPAACAHPVTVATIRKYLLPTDAYGGLSDDETASALELAKVELDEVTSSNIRADVHEMSCEANLKYGEAETDKFPIAYKIRPSAEGGKPPIFYIRAPELATVLIMGDPLREIKARRPSPAEADPGAVAKDPAGAPQRDGQGNTVSDDALFAPH